MGFIKRCITTADLLNDCFVPFFDAQDVKPLGVLIDRGSEYSHLATPK
jgi:hypothetical protein